MTRHKVAVIAVGTLAAMSLAHQQELKHAPLRGNNFSFCHRELYG